MRVFNPHSFPTMQSKHDSYGRDELCTHHEIDKRVILAFKSENCCESIKNMICTVDTMSSVIVLDASHAFRCFYL